MSVCRENMYDNTLTAMHHILTLGKMKKKKKKIKFAVKYNDPQATGTNFYGTTNYCTLTIL